MNPREFEDLVCQYFRNQNYKAETTPYCNDYGVDVFATKDKEKIAVQAKMYGSTTRKINRQTVMELHGAKDYFECTKAVIATDGTLLPDAITVAKKLKIEILHIDGFPAQTLRLENTTTNKKTFEQIWEKYILPLQGKTLIRRSGESNQIIKVDWGGIERITSKGNKGKIKIEIFKLAVNVLISQGCITRDEINQNYPGRASSGVILVLLQVPFFRQMGRPAGLKYVQNEQTNSWPPNIS